MLAPKKQSRVRSILACLSFRESVTVRARVPAKKCCKRVGVLDLKRGYEASFPPNQVNDSNKGSNGPAGSRSGKLHSE